jgi:hypothetical protein
MDLIMTCLSANCEVICMSTKVCFKCNQEKPLSAYYRHPQMAGGHLNKCKECKKEDVRGNRKAKLAYYREYDRERGSRQSPEYCKEYLAKYPEKYKTHNAVNNAVRDGRLVKAPCIICGASKAHGHHDNYGRPLDVVWLCAAHHKQRHQSHEFSF